MYCISFSANVTRGLWLFGCRKYIIHDYNLINFFCLIICSIYLNNSFNKRCAFSFILQEQLYTVLLSILYIEGDVPKPIILFVALSAFQILILRIAQTSTRGQYVRTFRDHQVFSKRQIIFRLQVKGWRSWRRPGNRCPRHEPIPPQLIRFTHVRVKVILIYVRRSRNCDESPLHTALCAGEEADGYLASATRIPIEHSFIRLHSP